MLICIIDTGESQFPDLGGQYEANGIILYQQRSLRGRKQLAK